MRITDLQKYVEKNYEKLPHSTFNNTSCVIVAEIKNENFGWGNHSYEGIGLNKKGEFLWCYSSGCSCEGSCHANEQDLKIFKVRPNRRLLPSVLPTKQGFLKMEVHFSDYE